MCLVEGVPARLVGVVANEAGVKVLHEPVGPVVERDPQDRHIVGVHVNVG